MAVCREHTPNSPLHPRSSYSPLFALQAMPLMDTPSTPSLFATFAMPRIHTMA